MVRQRIRLLALVAVVGVATACDAPNQPATKSVLAPRYDALTSNGYSLMTSDVSSDQTKTAVIDSTGGFIRFQGSALIVPPGAVPSPTTFTMRLHTQPFMGADLSAVDEYGSEVTVFPVPLKLTISYSRAKDQLPSGSTVAMAWIENGIVLSTLPSSADIQGKKVTAEVTHFTEFGPVTGIAPSDPFSAN